MSGRIGYDQWPYGEPPPKEIITGEPTPFATFIRGRNPTFKSHTSLAHAKGALSNTHQSTRVDGVYRKAFTAEGALYEWDGANNQWLPRLHVQKGTTQQDYILWSDPKAFKQGISSVIEEDYWPEPPWPCCAGPNSCSHTVTT